MQTNQTVLPLLAAPYDVLIRILELLFFYVRQNSASKFRRVVDKFQAHFD